MKTSLLDRRSFIKMAGAAWATTLAPASLQALERTDAVFASGFMERDGRFGLATVAEDGTVIEKVALPARSHGLAYSPANGCAVAFARRPGTFALIFDTRQSREPVVIHAGEDRHFFGHGSFSPDGRLLYASENDFEANRGVIGLYDATDGYRRIGEFDTYGIGTHDMTVSDDGRLLIVANGGIETHPDFGRTKLNLDHMEPSLALIDAATGALIERHALPPSLRQLSTRHVDIDAKGRVWFACQYEGPRNDLPPLAGHFAKGEDIRFLDLPDETTMRLANYVGAIAVNRAQGLVGLTSPKGGLAVTIDAASGSVLGERRVDDAAGIAPSPHGFAVSSYDGRFDDSTANLAWDQHIIRLGTL
ncbi:DUF1513 domain-containing protein [Rhizobium sp. TRM96647]|uniref:DUF1513 domain-containing protein n=1 Tax=unclassified Rhizobium TaxID=2613769 RepID=UPI0021E877FF|nr:MULTISPECIES: DUF1513 domain-containing protein [unclassified Rhizobium]MCV3736517.1 DUF1513 domain-containing protein [Rhizobium sp. TRM96647]MCV3758886.1 DUF1513 domain-containing protein [Rhizobium sp. TRM96650]